MGTVQSEESWRAAKKVMPDNAGKINSLFDDSKYRLCLFQDKKISVRNPEALRIDISGQYTDK